MTDNTIFSRMKRALIHNKRFAGRDGQYPAPELLSEKDLLIYEKRVRMSGGVQRSEIVDTLDEYKERFIGRSNERIG